MLWNWREWLILPRVGWGAGERCERFHRGGYMWAGFKSIIRSCLGGEVGRAVHLEKETKSSSKCTEMRRSLWWVTRLAHLCGSDGGQGGARPNSWNAKLRTLTLSHGHENSWRSLGRANWYFIHKILVLIYNDRNPIDLYLTLYIFQITLVNCSSNSLFCIGIVNRKGLK